MSETPHNDDALDVWPDRRSFIKKAAAVTAFTAPMIASFDLASLGPSVAQAATSNMSNTTTISNTTTSNTFTDITDAAPAQRSSQVTTTTTIAPPS